MKRIWLFLNTVRYLKFIQIAGRIWFRFYKPKPDFSSAPPLRELSGEWVEPILKTKSRLSLTTFRFLNQENECNTAIDWNNEHYDKLWLYNLHYFDYINVSSGSSSLGEVKIGKIETRDLMDRWIIENPAPMGNGWESYPLSLRIVNWIKWHLAGGYLSQTQLDSLAIQVRYLNKRLEYHLLGNHLLANAKSLIYAGLFFDGREAECWLIKGVEIYSLQLKEQILPDGGHFERSPMYHSIMLEDLLDIWNFVRSYKYYSTGGINEFRLEQRNVFNDIDLPKVINEMLKWLSAMCHPDGKIALFNDAAFEIAPTLKELNEYALRLDLLRISIGGRESKCLTESGYARLQKADVVVIADVGSVGPSYQPGHAHASTLSFEMSQRCQRIFVDSGTSCYGTSSERLRQRKSASHNTVLVDGEDSSEVWSGHRVARRASVSGVRLDETGACCLLKAEHDGYSRLPGVTTLSRQWLLSENELKLSDRISGSGVHQIEVAFHLHPDLRVEINESDIIVIKTLDGHILGCMTFAKDINIEILESTYHPQFGLSVSNNCITGRIKTSLPIEFTTNFMFSKRSDDSLLHNKEF